MNFLPLCHLLKMFELWWTMFTSRKRVNYHWHLGYSPWNCPSIHLQKRYPDFNLSMSWDWSWSKMEHLNWKPWKPWFLPPKYRGFNVFNPNISQEAIVLSFASWPHHQRNLPPPQDGFEALKSGYHRSIPWIIHFPIDFSHFSPRGFRIQRHHFRRI